MEEICGVGIRKKLLLLLWANHSRLRSAASTTAGYGQGSMSLSVLFFFQWQPLVGCVAKRGGHDDHWAGSEERTDHAAADDLALAAGEVDSEASGGGRGGGREEGPGEGEDIEAAVEADDRAGGRRLPERHVGDGAAAAEDADASLPATGVSRDALPDVAAAGDLDQVRPQRVGAVPRYDDGRLRLVLGPRRPPPRPPRAHLITFPHPYLSLLLTLAFIFVELILPFLPLHVGLVLFRALLLLQLKMVL